MSVSTEVNVMDFAEDFGPTIEPIGNWPVNTNLLPFP